MYIIFFKFLDLRKWTPAWVVPFLLAMDWTNFSNFRELSLIKITFLKRWITSLSLTFESGEIFLLAVTNALIINAINAGPLPKTDVAKSMFTGQQGVQAPEVDVFSGENIETPTEETPSEEDAQ